MPHLAATSRRIYCARNWEPVQVERSAPERGYLSLSLTLPLYTPVPRLSVSLSLSRQLVRLLVRRRGTWNFNLLKVNQKKNGPHINLGGWRSRVITAAFIINIYQFIFTPQLMIYRWRIELVGVYVWDKLCICAQEIMAVNPLKVALHLLKYCLGKCCINYVARTDGTIYLNYKQLKCKSMQ